jgi:hypothetical protein
VKNQHGKLVALVRGRSARLRDRTVVPWPAQQQENAA